MTHDKSVHEDSVHDGLYEKPVDLAELDTGYIQHARIALGEIPVVKSFFREFDTEVGNVGLIAASRRFIEGIERRSRAFYSVDMPEDTHEVLLSQPALVIANHPYRLDTVFLLGALPPERKDIRVLARSFLGGVGKHFRSHIIPVFYRKKSMSSSSSPTVRFHLARVIEPTFEDTVTKNLNERSLARSVDTLEQGGILGILPGGNHLQGGWQAGVGKIVQGLARPEDIPVIFAHIKGSTPFDPFSRLFPGWRNRLPQVNVRFSHPVLASQFRLNQDPLTTTGLMENWYKKWCEDQGLDPDTP